MPIDLSQSKVLITGSRGFIGSHLINALRHKYGCADANLMCLANFPDGYDLRDSNDVEELFDKRGPFEYVFHLAGRNGSIQTNLNTPAVIFFDNTLMALHVIDACYRHGTKKILSMVTSCAYPFSIFQYFDGKPEEVENHELTEDMFLAQSPHPTIAPHGYAKRNIQLASMFYNRQYGLKAVTACPNHVIGPGDSTDPERTKVMMGMIKRFVDATENNDPEVTCWGTGAPLREFIYVEDVADLLVQTMLHYNDSTMPLNLGFGQEISIKDLAETVAAAVGYKGQIKWDTSKPDGQMRKLLDCSRMQEILGNELPFTSLKDGIAKTVEWYRQEKANSAKFKVFGNAV